jgi:glutamine amidotransferase
MCVIVNQPIGTTLDRPRAERLWDRNSDGGGFSYIHDDGTIRTKKYMDFSPFWRDYCSAKAQFGAHSDFLLHMRIATHGSVSLDNVHPFDLDDHTVMAHNGVIGFAGAVDKKDKRSDTRIFVEEFLPELPEHWLDNPYLVKMVEEAIGGSKLVFLTTNPGLRKETYILNAKQGTEVDGMWFSNAYGLNEPKPVQQMQWAASWEHNVYRSPEGRWTPAQKHGHRLPLPNKPTETKKTEGFKVSADLGYLEAIMDDMKQRRLTNLVIHHDLYYVRTTGKLICEGCLREADDDTGLCECYEMACTYCMNFTVACTDECLGRSAAERRVLLPSDVRFQKLIVEKKLNTSDVLLLRPAQKGDTVLSGI